MEWVRLAWWLWSWLSGAVWLRLVRWQLRLAAWMWIWRWAVVFHPKLLLMWPLNSPHLFPTNSQLWLGFYLTCFKCRTAIINIRHVEKLPWTSLRGQPWGQTWGQPYRCCLVPCFNQKWWGLQSSCLQADWANLLDRVKRLAESCEQGRRCIPS